MSYTANLLLGDARTRLAELPAGSVQTCVTSPPYFGLRDYGTASWNGGDGECDHRHESEHQKQVATSARAGRSNIEAQRNENFRSVCGKCGATRIDSQIGLEATPDAYVAELVTVFREVRRVLRDDGTVWLNLGDSYASTSTYNVPRTSNGAYGRVESPRQPNCGIPVGYKPKDLLGIPWRVAFALQADGWYLRADIIWHKPNPMPESVTDRPTKSHEYIFLLTKSPRYYYNAAAIAESRADDRLTSGNVTSATGERNIGGRTDGLTRPGGDMVMGATRNKRSVWTVATQPYPGAHFAVMPEALIAPCILAGSQPGDLVLDPFAGAGTVGVVAVGHGRDFVGCELNPTYAAMAEQRIRANAPLFNVVAVV